MNWKSKFSERNHRQFYLNPRATIEFWPAQIAFCNAAFAAIKSYAPLPTPGFHCLIWDVRHALKSRDSSDLGFADSSRRDANRPDRHQLPVVRLEVDARHAFEIDRLCNLRGMTRLQIHSRLIRWVASLNPVLQQELMNAKAPSQEAALRRRILGHLAKNIPATDSNNSMTNR
jgi:hypothetical protein